MLTFGEVKPPPVVQMPLKPDSLREVVMSCWNSEAEQIYSAGKLMGSWVLSAILLLHVRWPFWVLLSLKQDALFPGLTHGFLKPGIVDLLRFCSSLSVMPQRTSLVLSGEAILLNRTGSSWVFLGPHLQKALITEPSHGLVLSHEVG